MKIVDSLGKLIIVIFSLVYRSEAYSSTNPSKMYLLFSVFIVQLFGTMLMLAMWNSKRIQSISVHVLCILVKLIFSICFMKYGYKDNFDVQTIVYVHVFLDVYKNYLDMLGLGLFSFSVYIVLILYHLYYTFLFRGTLENIYLGNLLGVLLVEVLNIVSSVGRLMIK